MLFWIVAAALTFAACLAVLLPLSRRAVEGTAPALHDAEVYRDQLAELERDAGRGVIAPSEAGEARAEIARRLLKANAALGNSDGGASRAADRLLGMAAVLLVPIIAWGGYALTGSPDIPSQPLQARLEKAPGDSTIEELIAKAEAHLARSPDDARGWDVLAPIYLRVGRFADAVTAYSNAIRLAGTSAPRESGLGEAIVAAGGGVVSADARAAFERALSLDPAEPRSRYFLATAKAQEGSHETAIADWRALAADQPQDSPWREAANRAVAEAGRMAARTDAEPAAGSAEQDLEAAAGMDEAERSEMIRTMVASLDAKLRTAPDDVEGWKRLVRSYLVLDQEDDARDALERGLVALGKGSAGARDLSAFAAAAGLAARE